MGFVRTSTWQHNGTHCDFCGRKIEANVSYYNLDGKHCCSACIDAAEAKHDAKRKAELDALKAKMAEKHLAKTKKGGEKDVLKWKKQYEQLGKNISDLEKALRGNDADVIDKCRGRSVSGGSFMQLLRNIFYAPSYIFWVGAAVWCACWAYDRYIAKEGQKIHLDKVALSIVKAESTVSSELTNVASNELTNAVNE